nr:MAG TPA: hypothetical protein [Caudoviricetes sp.]
MASIRIWILYRINTFIIIKYNLTIFYSFSYISSIIRQ